MKDSFLIQEETIELAQEVCKYIDAPQDYNRALANITAAIIAKNYFEDIDVDVTSGIYNISQVIQNIEIADIYIKNNYIDVRLCFDENDMCVPKQHFDLGVLPIAYMFIKVSEDISSGEVLGFAPANAINIDSSQGKYYKVNENNLVSYYDVESLLIENSDVDIPENIDSLIYDYLDNRIENLSDFYNYMLSSVEARIKFRNAAKTQNILQAISWKKENCTTNENIESNSGIENDLNNISSDDLLNNINVIDNTTEEDMQLIEETSQEFNFDLDDSLPDLEIDDNVSASLTEELPIEEETLILEEDIKTLDSNNNKDTVSLDTSEQEELVENSQTPIDVKEEIETEVLEFVEDFNEDYIDKDQTILDEDVEIIELEGENIESVNPSYDYTTETTPSITELDEDLNSNINNPTDTLEDLLSEENETSKTIEMSDVKSDSTDQIDTLFDYAEDNTSDNISNDDSDEEKVYVQSKKKNNTKLLPVICLIGVLSAVGYYGYNTYMSKSLPKEKPLNTKKISENNTKQNPNKKTVAMPIETVENKPKENQTNEGNGISIPAIEQNLGASITISNLNVNWEVPNSFVSSATAKRYLTKMGKIIQLNLKSELLLLNKPPITNKIEVEIEYNKNLQQFEVKGIITSSGEKVVDDVILQAIKNALKINLSMNMNTFNNTLGNPILVIRL